MKMEQACIFSMFYNNYFEIMLLLNWIKIPHEKNKLVFIRDELTRINLFSAYDFWCTSMKLLGEVLERFVFLKITAFGYWNNVSINLRFLGIFSFSGTATIIIYRLGLSNQLENVNQNWTSLTTFAAIFSALFWQERSSYYEKWKYLSNLYNEVLKAKPYVIGVEAANNDIYSYRESLKFALAMDIVQMEMWSHQSFKSLVEICLKELIKYRYGIKTEVSDIDLYTYVNYMTKDQVLSNLSWYQNILLEREKNSYKNRAYLKMTA